MAGVTVGGDLMTNSTGGGNDSASTHTSSDEDLKAKVLDAEEKTASRMKDSDRKAEINSLLTDHSSHPGSGSLARTKGNDTDMS